MLAKVCILLLGILLLTACATPAGHFAEAADAYGFVGYTVKSKMFEHQIYSNIHHSSQLETGALHVYLDGDGSPWHQKRWLNDDPTSRNPLILDLMHQDNAASLMLGRPCYHGFSQVPPCHFKYWTSHRYAQEVINSMVQALRSWLNMHPYKHIVLIGYSGGGALAILMAPHLADVETVVTVAANLDVDAWSRYHGYGPLAESLNPATLALLPSIRQIHIAGLDDTIVPAPIIESFANGQTNSLYWAYPDFDHHCCWSSIWKSILSKF
ncbi:MAG: lipase family protein [Gammaproteobacteria bacterium]